MSLNLSPFFLSRTCFGFKMYCRPLRPPRLVKHPIILPNWPCSAHPQVNMLPFFVSAAVWSFPEAILIMGSFWRVRITVGLCLMPSAWRPTCPLASCKRVKEDPLQCKNLSSLRLLQRIQPLNKGSFEEIEVSSSSIKSRLKVKSCRLQRFTAILMKSIEKSAAWSSGTGRISCWAFAQCAWAQVCCWPTLRATCSKGKLKFHSFFFSSPGISLHFAMIIATKHVQCKMYKLYTEQFN